MYSYTPKGQWLDCNTCGRSHREILPSDLTDYLDVNLNKLSLSNDDLKKCFYCNPITVFYKYECSNCNNVSIIESSYNTEKIHICPICNFDTIKIKSPSIVESQPKLDGGAKELFNRIKKRNIGSNMPDY